jgi:hypothetical protein
MMTEIFDDGQVSAIDEHLLATLHTLELVQRVEFQLRRILSVDQQASGDRGHRRVPGVEEARQGPLHAAPLLALPEQREGRASRGFLEVGDDGVVASARAHADDRSPGHVLHQTEDVGVIAIRDDYAVARDDANDMRERAEHVVEVTEDIGVVELAVVHREHVRQVLDELAALVEERGVVFVAFDDEGAALLTGIGRVREVARDAPDEPAGLSTVGLQQDRGHTGRGGLAMRTGHDDVTAFIQQASTEKFRQRDVRLGAGFEEPFHFGMTAGGNVTDDDQIRLQLREAFGRPTF